MTVMRELLTDEGDTTGTTIMMILIDSTTSVLTFVIDRNARTAVKKPLNRKQKKSLPRSRFYQRTVTLTLLKIK